MPTPSRLAPAHLAMALVLLIAGCVPARQVTPTAPPQQQQPQVTPLPPLGPAKVALLLPLSGPSGAVGKDMEAAAQMALFDTGGDIVLLIRDTGGTVETAQAAASSVLDAGAELVLGPVFSSATSAVANVARPRGVNVLSFSNNAAVAGNGVYVLGYRPEEQAERVVGYALDQGVTRIGVLAPDDGYGSLVTAAWARMMNYRPELLANGVATYPAQGDPAPVVREFTRNMGLANGRSNGGNAAVLIADGGLRLRQVASLLTFYDVDPAAVRFLGTRRWEEDRVFLRDPAVRGAWIASIEENVERRFKERFAAAFGREPDPLAALAYDAATLAARLATQPERFTVPALTNPRGFDGSQGVFRIEPNGLTRHGLAILEVTPEGIRTIAPAPRSLDDRIAMR